jgi:penicillin-binding protein 2
MKNLRVAKLTVGSLVLAGLSLGIPSAFGWQASLVQRSQTSTRHETQKDLARLERTRLSDSPQASRPAKRIGHKVAVASASRTVSASGEVFLTSSFANHVAEGDVTGGEDPVVRQAAVAAVGHMNGTVLAIEPTSGRILAMVNQKLALSSGAQPCSTIKLSVALTALSEGIITKETEVRIGANVQMNLTIALARSNNQYFETLGRELGFEKVSFHAHQYGLGELAGLNISGERPGIYPSEEIPRSWVASAECAALARVFL